jgi:glycosyltransferase involved in cell wall biosynthesis
MDLRRVVVLNDDSMPKGGASGLALLSAKLLRRRGLRVTFIAGDSGNNPSLSEDNIPVIAMGERRLLEAGPRSTMLRGLYNHRTLSLVGHWIQRNDTPDTVYHLHSWSQIFSPSIFKALESVRERTFITAHDFFLVCPNGAYALYNSGQSCPLTPLGLSCLATSCDRRNYAHKLWRVARQSVQSRLLTYDCGHPRVLAIHEAMRPLLERGGVPPSAIVTMPNPIRPWSATRIKAEHNGTFVFVGRLNEEKGADLAAKAARRARVPMTIVGDGPMLEELSRTYPEVTFFGRQLPEAVAKLVRSARALIMPSRYPEPYGLVAGEALWSGLPVILAEQALIAPQIVARGAGLSCNPRDEQELAGAMARLAEDDKLIQRMSVDAFENTRDLGNTEDSWADALVQAYRGAVSPEFGVSTLQATRDDRPAFAAHARR